MSNTPSRSAAPAPVALAVDSLLTIDVDAEVRKLSQAQLAGTWQLPVELVRCAIASGAQHVRVALGRRSLTLECDGPGLGPSLVARLCVVADPKRPSTERHEALVELEASGQLGVLALAGLQVESVELITHGASTAETLTARLRKGSASWDTRDLAPTDSGFRVDIRGLALDHERARSWLMTACRFTQVAVAVDGKPVPKGLPGTMFTAPLRKRLPGWLAFTRSGDTARVWLLLDGVVATHVTLPRAAPFEAAVELRARVGSTPAGAAALREALVRDLRWVLAPARRELVRQARNLRGHSPRAQSRIRSLVLATAKHGGDSHCIWTAPVFRALPTAAHPERWLSLNELDEQSARNGGLLALRPGDEPARFVLPDEAPVLVLDDAERGLLGKLLATDFRLPPARPGAGGRSLRELLRAGSRGLARAAEALRSPWLSPIPDERLTAPERAFLDALRRELPDTRVGFCKGRGAIRRSGRPARLWLPRSNPTVGACLQAWSREPAWLYPAAIALLGGEGLPSVDLADTWHDR